LVDSFESGFFFERNVIRLGIVKLGVPSFVHKFCKQLDLKYVHPISSATRGTYNFKLTSRFCSITAGLGSLGNTQTTDKIWNQTCPFL